MNLVRTIQNVEIINNKLCPGFNTSTFMEMNVKNVTDLILCENLNNHIN